MNFDFFLTGKSKNVNTICLILSLCGTNQNQQISLRTPFRIAWEEWDANKQRPKNIYLKKHKKLNTKLDRIKVQFADHFIRKKELPSPTKLRQKLKELCSTETVYIENSLLYYMQWYINSKRGLICNSTYKRYNVFIRLIARFEGFMCRTLSLKETNSDFVRDFIRFGKEEAYSESTIYRTINFVKTILNFAERKGTITSLRELELRSEKTRSEIITLKEEEIQKIKKTVVPQEFQAAKDWLLISCYTGQRISDFMNFNRTNIENIEGLYCLSFKQQKTKKDILLPIHPEVWSVLERNKGNFPQQVPKQFYNEQIKEVARISGINQPVSFNKRQGHRSVIQLIPKWKSISSHIGRRSFASNFYGKIPTPLLMEATGHSTEKMFQKYISNIDRSRVLELGMYFEKVYKNNLNKIIPQTV